MDPDDGSRRPRGTDAVVRIPAHGSREEPQVTGWTWEYEGYVAGDERLRESLCTLGNGYFATRGALPECAADEVHYPGTYVAGCYNRLTSQVAGRQVENEDMVNVPNWLPLRFRLHEERWLTPPTPRPCSTITRS
ncbi:hypothetical protein [Streptomyces prunicolor]